jgi:hypothetical protein
MADQPRMPDFRQMLRAGLDVLAHGLPELPTEFSHSIPIPLAFWKDETYAAVLFLFYFTERNGSIKPGEISFEYERDTSGWRPIEATQGYGWTAIRNNPVSSPRSLEYDEQFAIKSNGSHFDSGSKPGHPAIVIFGRHAPDVAEIRLLQGHASRSAPAIGHFGAWIICSETFAPFRIEAHDSSGNLIGFLDEPAGGRLFPEPPPLDVVTPEDAELPHQYGGHMQVLRVERYPTSVKVKWHITLEPDPDVELAKLLDDLDRRPDPAWPLERVAQHVRLVDVLKLTVLFVGEIALTDDVGTVYETRGGGGSTGSGEATWSQEFVPSIPDAATVLNVHRNDLDLTFRLQLR